MWLCVYKYVCWYSLACELPVKDSRSHAIFVYWEGFATFAAHFWALWCLDCELRQHLSLEAPSLMSWHKAHWSFRLGLLATRLVEPESWTKLLCCETTQAQERLQVWTSGPTDCFRSSKLYSPGPLSPWEPPALEVNEFSTTQPPTCPKTNGRPYPGSLDVEHIVA